MPKVSRRPRGRPHKSSSTPRAQELPSSSAIVVSSAGGSPSLPAVVPSTSSLDPLPAIPSPIVAFSSAHDLSFSQLLRLVRAQVRAELASTLSLSSSVLSPAQPLVSSSLTVEPSASVVVSSTSPLSSVLTPGQPSAVAMSSQATVPPPQPSSSAPSSIPSGLLAFLSLACFMCVLTSVCFFCQLSFAHVFCWLPADHVLIHVCLILKPALTVVSVCILPTRPGCFSCVEVIHRRLQNFNITRALINYSL